MLAPIRRLLVLAALVGCSPGVIDTTGSASGSGGTGAGGTGAGGAAGGFDAGTGPGGCEIDPGRVTLHRLNRVEYDNTMRDLIGDSTRPARDFPSDDSGGGFDNNADVLSLSPLLLEKYQLAAEALVDTALRPPRTAPNAQRFEAEAIRSDVGAEYQGEGWNLWSNGALAQAFTAPEGATYKLAARAFGTQAGDEPARMRFSVDGREVRLFDVAAVRDQPAVYQAETTLAAGMHTFTVEFTNDFYQPDAGLDRNLIVDWIEVEGMFAAPPDPASRGRIVTCDPATAGPQVCAREVVAAFGRRAWRRPLEDEEVTRLAAFVDLAIAEGEGFDEGISLALEAILLSPHFLFRVELDPDPASPLPHPLTDHELAARLSYFLWSSMPDDALFAAADQGRMRDPAAIEAEARRMLADPRAEAIVGNFAGQWLYTRGLDNVEPDYARFPDWDDVLRESMRTETQLYFRTLLAEDGTIADLLSSDFTFVNARLAQHYGLPPVAGSEFQRVSLAGTERRGLLTQGSVLATTAYPTRTSIVKRGKFVLSQLLCREPDPPPPGVEGLVEEVDPTASLRDRMQQHRANPECAVCHDAMDPLGFGLEHFDAVGKWRDMDGRFPVDSTGELSGGRAFTGAREMAGHLAADPDLPSCAAKMALTYALGRSAANEHCSVGQLVEAWGQRNYTLKELLVLITTNPTFRMRRGGP